MAGFFDAIKSKADGILGNPAAELAAAAGNRTIPDTSSRDAARERAAAAKAQIEARKAMEESRKAKEEARKNGSPFQSSPSAATSTATVSAVRPGNTNTKSETISRVPTSTP